MATTASKKTSSRPLDTALRETLPGVEFPAAYEANTARETLDKFLRETAARGVAVTVGETAASSFTDVWSDTRTHIAGATADLATYDRVLIGEIVDRFEAQLRSLGCSL